MYLHPFFDPSTRKKYYNGTKFEDALELYRFDDELRDILFSIIGRIEIKLKTKLDSTICTFTNDIFWYLDLNLLQIKKTK